MPTSTLEAPVKVFAPDNANVPAPVPPFDKPKLPDTTPDIVPVVVFATCTVASADNATVPDNVPAAEKFTAPADNKPAPAIVNGSCDVTTPATSNVAPLATVVVLRVSPSVVSPSAFALVIFTVPSEIEVVPVYVLAADSSSVPAPVLVRPAAAGVVTPEMTPDIVPVVKLAT